MIFFFSMLIYVISIKNGSIVMLSEEDYNGLMETLISTI